MAEKFWGKVFGVAAKTVAFPFAVIGGVVNTVKGEDFEKGYDNVYDECKSTIDDIEEYGDKNNNGITTCVGTVGIVLTTIATGKAPKKK